MSKKQQIIDLYLSGKSKDEILEIVKTSRRYVSNVVHEYGRGFGADNVIFPAVRMWMRTNRITYKEIADKAGYRSNAIVKSLTGFQPPNKYVIDAILQMSGMTYEEAFRE